MNDNCECRNGIRGKNCHDYHPREGRMDEESREAERICKSHLATFQEFVRVVSEALRKARADEAKRWMTGNKSLRYAYEKGKAEGEKVGFNRAKERALKLASGCYTKDSLTCEVQKCEEIATALEAMKPEEK